MQSNLICTSLHAARDHNELHKTSETIASKKAENEAKARGFYKFHALAKGSPHV